MKRNITFIYQVIPNHMYMQTKVVLLIQDGMETEIQRYFD